MLTGRHAGRLKHDLLLTRFTKVIKQRTGSPLDLHAAALATALAKPENLPRCVAQIFHSVA